MPTRLGESRLEAPETKERQQHPMPHHLVPSELARLMGMDRREVIAKCLETGVPIHHGRIDKTLFTATIRERVPPQTGDSDGNPR